MCLHFGIGEQQQLAELSQSPHRTYRLSLLSRSTHRIAEPEVPPVRQQQVERSLNLQRSYRFSLEPNYILTNL